MSPLRGEVWLADLGLTGKKAFNHFRLAILAGRRSSIGVDKGAQVLQP